MSEAITTAVEENPAAVAKPTAHQLIDRAIRTVMADIAWQTRWEADPTRSPEMMRAGIACLNHLNEAMESLERYCTTGYRESPE
jgi:hypothetical protein